MVGWKEANWQVRQMKDIQMVLEERLGVKPVVQWDREIATMATPQMKFRFDRHWLKKLPDLNGCRRSVYCDHLSLEMMWRLLAVLSCSLSLQEYWLCSRGTTRRAIACLTKSWLLSTSRPFLRKYER
jgi:hypothetical protein